MKNEENKKVAIAEMVIATLIWGSSFFIIKNSLHNISAYSLGFYRYFSAAILLGIYLILSKRKLFKDFKVGLVLGIFLFFTAIPQIIGLKYTSSANSGFITGLFVVITPILSFLFLKKKLSLGKSVAAILALIGLWILTGGVNHINIGDLITLITPVAISFYNIYAEKYLKPEHDILVLTLQQFVTVAFLSFIAVIITKSSLNFNLKHVLPGLAYVAIFPTVISFILQLSAQKKITAVQISLIGSLEVVFTALFSWTLGKEQFVLRTALGGVLIFIGIVVSEIAIKIPRSKSHNKEY